MAKKKVKSEEPKKNVRSEEPKKKKPISLNILEIAKRLQKLEEADGGGGGGGGSEFSKTTLFTSDTDVVNITLSDSITNYDAISVIAGFTDSGGHQRYMSTFYSDTLMATAGENVNYGTTNDAAYVHFKVIDATHLERTHRNKMNIEQIIGVKY